MSASYVPAVRYLLVATAASRDALPASAAPEGTLVYCAGDQITYQRNATARTGTSSDWVTFSAVNPYTIPQFTAFAITGVGTIQVDGATISGNHTFTWTTSPSANVAASSLDVSDLTDSLSLATGLADDGAQAITLPATITLHPGDSHAWRIAGVDTKGNVFTRNFTVTCVSGSDLDYYVRTDGADGNGGLVDNAGGAWLTLQHAADNVDVGDTVHVRTGTFAAPVLGWDTPQSGASGHPITFDGGGVATINHRNNKTQDAFDTEGCSFVTVKNFIVINDGSILKSGIRLSAGGYGNVINGNDVSGVKWFGITGGFLQNFQITNNVIHAVVGAQNTQGHGIYSANAGDDGLIEGNEVYDCGTNAIHTNGDATQGGTGVQTNLRIRRNKLHNNSLVFGGAAVNCDGIRDSRIENNLIYDEHSAAIALYAIDASSPSQGNVVCNNTIVLATDSPASKGCIRLANGSSGNIIFNNILFNKNPAGPSICCDADSIPVSDYNLVVDRFSIDGGSSIINLAQWRTATGQDMHSTLVSSLSAIFNDAPGGDYTLKTSGAAINSGVATFSGIAAPVDDLDSNARPFAGAYDVGCYESQTVSVLITDVNPDDAAAAQAVDLVVTFTFDRDVSAPSIIFTLVGTSSGSVSGVLAYDSPSHMATFTPSAPLTGGDTFTATISAADAVSGGVTLADPHIWTFSTVGSHRLFGNAYTPPTLDGADGSNITLGVNFYSSTDGAVVKVWFYKAVANTGTHTAKVWSSTGTLLASKAFSGESASGWQSATLDTPLAITANTKYTASVHMPNGHYSFDNTIHTRSNSPLFTWDVLGSFHPSSFVSGDAWPGGGSASDNFYGIDVEVSS